MEPAARKHLTHNKSQLTISNKSKHVGKTEEKLILTGVESSLKFKNICKC